MCMGEGAWVWVHGGGWCGGGVVSRGGEVCEG